MLFYVAYKVLVSCNICSCYFNIVSYHAPSITSMLTSVQPTSAAGDSGVSLSIIEHKYWIPNPSSRY